jgi:hypothetical protein
MTIFRNRDNRSSVAACETAGISSNSRRPATKTSNTAEGSFKVIRDIAFTAFPGFQIQDLSGSVAAFEIAGRIGQRAYRPHIVSKTEARVVSSSS